MADKFTPEQRRAVTETEGNMLVSASAGSGKTHVMIERLIGIVLDGKARVSEILAGNVHRSRRGGNEAKTRFRAEKKAYRRRG